MNESTLQWIEQQGTELLAAMLVGTTIVMGLAFLATRISKRKSAAARATIWQSAFLILLFLPVATVVLPEVPLSRWHKNHWKAG